MRPEEHALTRQGTGYPLTVVVVVAFALRLYLAAATPLVFDEYQWINLADSVDIRLESLTLPLHGDQHPPAQVYFAAAGAWLFGHTQIGYRAASVLLGTLAVLAMYFVGKRLGGAGAGTLAAFLLATNEYHLGVSHLCTEKNYLTFALWALILFARARERPSTRRFLLLGATLGLGTLTKQAVMIWTVLLGIEMLRDPETRALLRRPAPWYGLAVMCLIVSPDVYWNLTSTGAAAGSGLGIGYQLSRLRPGAWSWLPLALYFRPLYYAGVGSGLSEYASMTSVAGATVLGGAIASCFFVRSAFARLLQLLGFVSFAFFTFFTKPEGEFWWADLTLLAFVPLASAAFLMTGRLKAVIIGAVTVVMAASAWGMVRTTDNYYALEWGAPPASVIAEHRNWLRLPTIAHRERDHLDLCSVGLRRLPVCAQYEANVAAYAAHLTAQSKQEEAETAPGGWPPVSPADLPAEQEWARNQLSRFRTSPR